MTAPTLRELCEAVRDGDYARMYGDIPLPDRDLARAILAALDAERAEATSIAYPRALQAAADVVLRVESHALDEVDEGERLAFLDDLANDILDLSTEEIDACAEQHR